MIERLIIKNRSYRRFFQKPSIKKTVLIKLINLARLSASASNLQPLKFAISYTKKSNSVIFPALRWAGYLKNWNGPAQEERPTAYILILGDKKISENFWCDHGIAAQSILLGATEIGFGGCMLGAIDKKYLMNVLKLDSRYEILLIIALGKPKEKVVIEALKNNNIKYWRDKKDVHHVPKRNIKDIIMELK